LGKINNTKVNKMFIFIFLSFLLKPVWLFDYTTLGTYGDDLSYWLHSTSLAFDYDLDYRNDHNFNEGTFNDITKAPSHPPGSGYMSAIFVKIFSFFDLINGKNIDRLNPIGTYAYLGYFFASQLFVIFGFYFINKLFLSKGIYKNNPGIFILTLLSTLIHFVGTRFLMSHASEFFIASFIIYIFERRKYLSEKDFYYLLFAYFFMSIIRPSTFIIMFLYFLIKHKNINLYKINYFKITTLLTLLVASYIFISRKLYNTNTILLNLSKNKTTEAFVDYLNFELLLEGIIKLPNLFFSPSGGLIWTAPIIFLGFFVTLINIYKDLEVTLLSKLATFFYIAGFFLVVIAWQGREIAYGQRLLIGLLPFFMYQVGIYYKNKKSYLVIAFILISYINYFYLYSSPNLTLKPGLSLWGTFLNFSSEDYGIYLFREIYSLSNIFTSIAKSIYSVNFFGLVEFDSLNSIFSMLNFDENQLATLRERASRYYLLPYSYILGATSIYFLFLYSFIYIIYDKKKN